ncbi:MAG: hypothetical protein UV41_C0006G0017 [Candidatus Daviesbacteria bacterium GW2011_GWA2_42_7]|uniref:Uncharacterized protein n=1 Tax=Candidatus Daviesbacteria bacterium GW2011_GWA2_42_7 TaxID=1618425 RepID=A0A0G1BCH2_9BACT|nr:MAG: hypothetical protein UV41_C0006G0017 [Candidatus Daviesbacteria bacterium GW2011_GWA2_42_7]
MSSVSSQTLNTSNPKEVKKQPVQQIGGRMGDFDETENYFETSRFVSSENFVMEPAAVVEAAETIIEGTVTVKAAEAIIREAAVVNAAENIIREAAAKPIQEENTIYGEYQGSLAIGESIKQFLEQTTELKADTTGPREINISPSDQKEAFVGLFSAGADTIKDTANKVISTAADTLTTTAGVTKDMVVKDIMGLGKKESPKTREEIEKANEDAAQRAHEQKFQINLTVPHPEVSVFELDNKVVSKSQLEEALGARVTSSHIDEKGGLRTYIKTEAERVLGEKDKEQENAVQKANTLAVATKDKGLGRGGLDKGTENPNHFTKATS